MSRVDYYVVDRRTGTITEAGNNHQSALAYMPLPTSFHERRAGLADPTKQYFDLNANEVKDKVAIAPGVSKVGNTATITPLPRPCRVFVDGVDYGIDADGTVVINFGGAGTYKVTIYAASSLPWTQNITVP